MTSLKHILIIIFSSSLFCKCIIQRRNESSQLQYYIGRQQPHYTSSKTLLYYYTEIILLPSSSLNLRIISKELLGFLVRRISHCAFLYTVLIFLYVLGQNCFQNCVSKECVSSVKGTYMSS